MYEEQRALSLRLGGEEAKQRHEAISRPSVPRNLENEQV
jgi:hypothetical protein